MKLKVNSDSTIAVDASLTRLVEGAVSRVLGRFATRLTRVEVHLSDVDKRKAGQADKRCLTEVRPRGAHPLSTSAKATKMSSAVGESLRKMQRCLTTLFGRRGRLAAAVPAPVSTAKQAVARKTTVGAKESTAVEKQTKLSPRGPKKKGIYQARRKSWPTR